MFRKMIGGKLKFTFRPVDGAHEVFVAGDFTEWKPVRMRRQEDGHFGISLRVPLGNHEYKFVVGQEWIPDPDNAEWALNPYGTMNSVAVV
jgi:1,4-alpha-glucan branching enzyme